MRRLIIPFVAALLGLSTAGATGLAGGCAGGEGCTLAGCESRVSVRLNHLRQHLPQADRARFCAEGNCHSYHELSRWPFIFVPVSDMDEHPINATLIVRDESGKTLAQAEGESVLRRVQPNGPDCEPTCFSAGFDFDPQSNPHRLIALG